MTRLGKVIGVGGWMLATSGGWVSAALNPNHWQASKALAGPAASGYVETPLDEEVFSRAVAPSWQDLRVVEGEAQEVPSLLRQDRDESGTEVFGVTMLNHGVRPGEYTSCVADLGAKPRPVNQLSLETSNQQFCRKVWVEGSDDQATWHQLVKEGFIYDMRGLDGHARMTQVSFPLTTYRYLRVRVWLTNEQDPFVITGVSVLRYVEKPGRTSRQAYGPSAWTMTDHPEDHATEWVVDRGRKGLPVAEMEFGVKNKNFNRRVMVLISEDRKEWRPISDQAVIYDYPGAEPASHRVRVGWGEANGRYVKVKVWNADNPPLEMTEFAAKSWQRFVVFQPQAGKSYRLLYGHPTAKAPQYDLAQLAPHLIKQVSAWQAGPEQVNPTYAPPPPPMTERKELVWGVLLGLTGVLGYFLVSLFRRVVPETQS